MLEPAPIRSSGQEATQYAFTQMSLSANGQRDGILWVVGCVGCITNNPPNTLSQGKRGVLLAFDAEKLGNPIFTRPIGTYPRFNAPTIANGRVYVPTFSGDVVVFGLKSSVPHFAAIWENSPGPAFVARHGLTSQEYQQQFDQLVGQQGFCLVDVSGYEVAGEPRFAAIWEKKDCPPFVARHGLTSQEYQQQFDELVGRQGFRLKLVDGYTVGAQDRFAAIWEKSPGPAFVARHGLTSQEYQQQFDQLVGQQGLRLIWITGY